jgi:hypothetical protein
LNYSTSILYFHIRKIHFSIFAHGKFKSKELSRLHHDHSHYNEKKLYEGEGRGPSRFLLAQIPGISRISCGNSGNFLKISGKVPSLDRKIFPSWANEKYCNGKKPGKYVPVRTRGYSRLRTAKLR